MAIKEVRIDKAINGVIAHLVRGDSRTQIIRLEIDRYDGGVDLAGLAWCIKVVNAAGASDVYPIDPVATDDQMLTIDWLVSGVATAAAGHTKVALEGASDAGGGAVVWRSGVGLIHVREGLDAIPSEDDEQLTALQTLILHVRNELEGVIAAGEAAEKAADAADAARAQAVAAEAARAEAEAARADAETQRAMAEAGRADAEERRADAEAQRNAAEAGRLAAEERRAQAENGRIDAENARASAEEQRAGAEMIRAQTWASLKSDAEAATSAASEAAEAANALSDVVDGLNDDLRVLQTFTHGKHAYGENIVVRSNTIPAGSVLGANSFNAGFYRRDVGASDSMLVLDCIAYLKAELEANETDYANITRTLYFQACGNPWGKGGTVSNVEWGKPYWFHDTRRDVITGYTSNSLPGAGDKLIQIRTQQGAYTTTGPVTITYTALRLYVNGI